jgi:hypothetical protein
MQTFSVRRVVSAVDRTWENIYPTFSSSLGSTLLLIEKAIHDPLYLWDNIVPRRTSNLREVRFGEVVVLKQISALHRKNLWKCSEYLFDLKFLEHMPQVISKLSLVLHFSIWAIEGSRKIRPLSAVLFWQISATIYVCLSIAFFFSSFDHRTFEEVATITKKGWFTIMFMLTLLIELCEILYEGSFQV